MTEEYINGQRVRIPQRFEGYSSLEDSVAGYIKFLKMNPRYNKVLQSTSIEEAIGRIGESGYATSPTYAPALRKVVSQFPEKSKVASTPNQIQTSAPVTTTEPKLIQTSAPVTTTALPTSPASFRHVMLCSKFALAQLRRESA